MFGLDDLSASPSGGTVSAPSSSRARLLTDAPPLVAGLAFVAVFVAWGQKGGGYEITRWAPGALLAVGLVVVAFVGGRGAARLGRLHVLAIASLGAFTLWSYVSIFWADVHGDAWIGANRSLLYAALFTLFVLLPWTARAGQVVACAFVAGVTAVAAHAVYRAATTDDDLLFVDGRFSYPTGYPNANVAFFLGGFWIALALATRREQAVGVRALALGCAVFLAQSALIVQSRASMLAVPLAAVALIAFTPGRLRTGIGLAITAVPLVAGWETHGTVYEQAEAGGSFLEDAMQPSARFMAVTALGGVIVGLVWALVDRRVTLPASTRRIVNSTALAALAVMVVVGAIVVARNNPGDRVRLAWSEFTTNTTEREGGSRLGSLDSQRWDHWRVGLDQFADHPARGIGVEQFNVDYLRERRTLVDARYVHSLPIGILSQLGLVGAFLFGAFAVAVTILVRPRRSDDAVVRTIGVGVFGLWVYWLIHASADWFYEIPGVTAPVFGFLGLAAALRVSSATSALSISRAPLVVAVVVCAVGLLALTPPYLAARELRAAVAVWPIDSEAAFKRLDRARRLDPLSDEPDLYAGAIATRIDDRALMRLHFTRALERNPLNWYARLQLGLSYSIAGRERAAVREARLAHELNPLDGVVEDALERLERGELVTPREVDRLFVERTLRRLR